MQTILIPSKPDDADAVFVAQALKNLGHVPVLWFPADFPIQQYSSFKLMKTEKSKWNIRGYYGEKIPENIDTVWLRRPRIGNLPDDIHPDDLKAVKTEISQFFDMMWASIAPDAFWVNDFASIKKSKSKLHQLEIATQLGLKVPETLLSNDPEEIKKFIQSYNKVIYKPLISHYWDEGDALKISYTNEVTCEMLPKDDILKLTPGIYQPKIEKAYELRVTFFGTYAVAVKLYSQEHPRGLMDWRSVPEKELKVESVDLPSDIYEKCLALLKHFGLKMGCFDFIVTPGNEYIYLEVNEQGQFLWIEEYNNQIPMLDIFTQFLIHNQFDYSYNASNSDITLDKLRPDIQEQMLQNQKNHQHISDI